MKQKSTRFKRRVFDVFSEIAIVVIVSTVTITGFASLAGMPVIST